MAVLVHRCPAHTVALLNKMLLWKGHLPLFMQGCDTTKLLQSSRTLQILH